MGAAHDLAAPEGREDRSARPTAHVGGGEAEAAERAMVGEELVHAAVQPVRSASARVPEERTVREPLAQSAGHLLLRRRRKPRPTSEGVVLIPERPRDVPVRVDPYLAVAQAECPPQIRSGEGEGTVRPLDRDRDD